MADMDNPVALAYDVQGTAAWIRELGLRKVALQLPVGGAARGCARARASTASPPGASSRDTARPAPSPRVPCNPTTSTLRRTICCRGPRCWCT